MRICLRCERAVHPTSPRPQVLTEHFVCTVKDGQCLRVNCSCSACVAEPGLYCLGCERELRRGAKPYKDWLCDGCMRKPEEFRRWLEKHGY